MMYLGNDLIEAIPLDNTRIPKPGYVGSIKRNLKMKYSELIQQYAEKPEFLVTEPLTEMPQSRKDNSSAN